MKKEFYLPSPVNPVVTCVGEHYFFTKIRHWKLAVILGYAWDTHVATQRGLSFFSLTVARNGKDTLLVDRLNSLGIKYKESISSGGWSYVITISHSKKNLALIDELYEEFFVEFAKRIFAENHLWRHGNKFINDEYRDYIKNKLQCPVDYYEEVTCIEDIINNQMQ